MLLAHDYKSRNTFIHMNEYISHNHDKYTFNYLKKILIELVSKNDSFYE